MLRWTLSAAFALVLALNVPVNAYAQNADGTWNLAYILNGSETTVAIVKIQSKNGTASGELVAASPRLKGLTLQSITQNGNALHIKLKSDTVDMDFDAVLPAKTPAKMNASASLHATLVLPGTLPTLYPGTLTLTDEMALPKDISRPLECPPAKQARTLIAQANSLRIQALQTKDAEKRKALLKKAVDADKTAKSQVPALYKEVIEKFADSPAVLEASLGLLRSAQANQATSESVSAWASAGMKLAKTYGPRYESDFAAQVATLLLGRDTNAKLALGYANQAEKALTNASGTAEQSRVLKLLVRALKADGKADDAKMYDVRLAKLEPELDREYMKTMPPFKGTPFAGRKGKSDRAAFMELFTGATCPPCIAADLAFDMLQKTYKPSELVLIQYHMHIPGPDTLTNPDTVARWAYYGKAVRGVPASIFDGKAVGGGGGGVVNAEKKYEAYREIIEPLLEIDAVAKLTAHAVRKGDRVNIDVSVRMPKDPGAAEMKLRILLAEETVRYAGSNKIRLHHNVVRAFPGGVEGKALTSAESNHQASIDISELRSSLNKYLTAFEANGRAFQNPARPMEMAHLRVIAFVQNDNTREILQAVQVEVEAK